MTLAAIKEKFASKINKIGDGEEYATHSVGLKNLSVTYKGETFSLYKTSSIFENHIVLSLGSSLLFSTRGWGRNGELDVFTEIYQAMIQYWREYAKEKKRDGVIVIADSKFGAKYNFAGLLLEKERTLLAFVVGKEIALKVDGASGNWQNTKTSHLKGAFISGDLKDKIGDTLEVIFAIEKFMEQKKIFSVADTANNDLRNLFRREIPFFYMGEEIKVGIKFPLGERGLRMNLKLNGEEKIIEPTTSALLHVLGGVEEERRLVNLVENPMDNFLAFVDEMAFKFHPFVYWSGEYDDDNKDVQKREFSLLCEKLGDWRVVEEEFAELRNKRLKVLANWKDERTEAGMHIYQGATQKNTFYFLVLQGDVQKNEESKGMIKVVNTPADKADLRKVMASMLLKDVF